MALDSHNNVFGRTLNPANLKLTAGGSSGGEATLVALRGSILGIGTDVGGSIRIPAFCHGLYGIKPSHGRIPYANQESGSKPGSDALGIRASAGPIAHSVRDCELLFKVVSDMEAWNMDPEVISQPYSGQSSRYPTTSSSAEQVLRVGILRTDGVTTPLPPIAHLLDEVASQLRNSNASIDFLIEVVDLNLKYTIELFSKCQSLANAIFSIDGANTMFDLLGATNEPLSPWLQTRLRRRPPHSLDKVRDLQARRNAMQTAFLDIWYSSGGHWSADPSTSSTTATQLDAIICPVAPHPVPEIDRWNTASYTSSFVLLDYPAATLPVRKMKASDLKGEIDTTTRPLSSWDEANRRLWTEVDRNVYLGTPLCVQVVGFKLQERKLLEVMEILDKVFKGSAVGSMAAKL